MPQDFSSFWCLDPSVSYLNHGSFGACPRAVLERQTELRRELESDPVEFLAIRLPERLHAARVVLAEFLSADPRDLAFVTNATGGVNALLRSLEFRPGDEILATSHTYAACRKTVDYVCSRTGARAVVADLPFPVRSADDVVAPVLAAASPRTRIALLDHVTSPTALVLPIATLVAELERRGIDSLVDGAHAPGMVPLALDALGAAYYTGNAHKWLCAPKGAAFLHVRRDRQGGLHPSTISHGYPSGFQAEFDWTGTCDPTAWLCIPDTLRHMDSLVPGGWPEVMARNRALALEARAVLLAAFAAESPCPADMVGSIASVPLPRPAPGSVAAGLDCDALGRWCRDRGIRTWLYPNPLPLVRVSAQLYNRIDEYRALARLLGEALGAG